ncbi:hypothetical protein RFI_33225, partial [Reticulomyxa filosa]
NNNNNNNNNNNDNNKAEEKKKKDVLFTLELMQEQEKLPQTILEGNSVPSPLSENGLKMHAQKLGEKIYLPQFNATLKSNANVNEKTEPSHLGYIHNNKVVADVCPSASKNDTAITAIKMNGKTNAANELKPSRRQSYEKLIKSLSGFELQLQQDCNDLVTNKLLCKFTFHFRISMEYIYIYFLVSHRSKKKKKSDQI